MRTIALRVIGRLALVVAAVLLLAVAGGLLAQLFRVVLVPFLGIGMVLAILQCLAALAAIALAPLFALIILSAAGPQGADSSPLRAAAEARSAYAPLLLVTVVAAVLGAAAGTVTVVIPLVVCAWQRMRSCSAPSPTRSR